MALNDDATARPSDGARQVKGTLCRELAAELQLLLVLYPYCMYWSWSLSLSLSLLPRASFLASWMGFMVLGLNRGSMGVRTQEEVRARNSGPGRPGGNAQCRRSLQVQYPSSSPRHLPTVGTPYLTSSPTKGL